MSCWRTGSSFALGAIEFVVPLPAIVSVCLVVLEGGERVVCRGEVCEKVSRWMSSCVEIVSEGYQ